MSGQLADSKTYFLFYLRQGYLKSLIEVMNTAEDLESLENLHALCSLMQTIRTSLTSQSPSGLTVDVGSDDE